MREQVLWCVSGVREFVCGVSVREGKCGVREQVLWCVCEVCEHSLSLRLHYSVLLRTFISVVGYALLPAEIMISAGNDVAFCHGNVTSS